MTNTLHEYRDPRTGRTYLFDEAVVPDGFVRKDAPAEKAAPSVPENKQAFPKPNKQSK